MIRKLSLFSIIVFLLTIAAFGQRESFPKAAGSGAFSVGGSGGAVIHVTNRDTIGPGSLHDALTTPGKRTIVFDVSGEFPIDVSAFNPIIQGSQYDSLTIAGQTAPLGGVTIKVANEFMFQELDEVIVRYVRIRMDSISGQDGHWYINGNNIIYDHVEFGYGADEAASWGSSSGTMGNVTIQNCFFYENKTGTILGVDNVSGNYTFINNLYAQTSHRFPNPKGDGHYDIFNNVVYNWLARTITIYGEGTYNIENNYYLAGQNGLRQPGLYGANGDLTNVLMKVQTKVDDSPLIHTKGNLIMPNNVTSPQADDRGMYQVFASSYLAEGDPVPDSYFTSTRFSINGRPFTILSAIEAYNKAIAYDGAGATKYFDDLGNPQIYRDSLSTYYVEMIKNDTAVDENTNGNIYQTDRTQFWYPETVSNSRPIGFDTDGDGMPNSWETLNNLNPDLADDKGFDLDPLYTNLEVYLNRIDTDDAISPPVIIRRKPKKSYLSIINNK